MKLKFVASLLLSLIAAPVFAHGDHDHHDDKAPVVKPGREVRKDAPPKAGTDDAAEEATKPANTAPSQ